MIFINDKTSAVELEQIYREKQTEITYGKLNY